VFIIYCGSHGVYEAVYNGVPILMMLLFGDITECMETQGTGVMLMFLK
jgi:hypothetical protein